MLVRLWLGNLILATVFSIIGYALALRIVNEFRRRVKSDDHPDVTVPPETTPAEE